MQQVLESLKACVSAPSSVLQRFVSQNPSSSVTHEKPTSFSE